MPIQRQTRRVLGAAATIATALYAAAAAAAAPSPSIDPKTVITTPVFEKIKAILSEAIVHRSIQAQNDKYGALAQAEIDRLDTQWRDERKVDDKPLISMTLSNPLSSYLTREQANSFGLYTAIFVMDKNGLNVGQSAITGDFWQGDEAKFQKTFPAGAGAVFIDEPEWIDEAFVWIAQVNLTIADPATGAPIGAATFDVNLTELERRIATAGGQ